MNIIDLIIIFIIVSGAIVGFKRGLINQAVSSIGFVVIVVLAFILKNPVSVFLFENLPFFKFAGVIKGVTVLNIALYEIIAFLIVLSILTVILKVILNITNIIETLIKITIILAPLSKIGGLIIGALEAYIWTFIFLYIASLPIFNIPTFEDSKYKDGILNNTIFLTSMTEKPRSVVDEFGSIKDKYETIENPMEFNRETLELFLKYDIVKPESIDVLVKKDKLKINNIDALLNKYRKA